MSFVNCICDVLGKTCGIATPCGIPGVKEAIEDQNWALVASLIIQGGACALVPHVIVAACVAGAFTCAFRANRDMSDEEITALIEEQMKQIDFEKVVELNQQVNH